MNKTALKNFATNARKELIEKVKAKAFKIGITEENIKKAQFESSDAIYIDGKRLSAIEKKQREKLISRIKEIGYQQVVEEVAYTWFNRFTALRFMEVNNYLPTKVRVLSSSNADSNEPDIIKEALTVDLDVDKELVYDLKINNNTEELFKYLVIKQCNHLNKILPFMFETIDDFKEILFPDGLLAKDSFLRVMTDLTAIPESNWEQVEIIGWLYQFYISEKKDQIFANLKKNIKISKDNIPAATQLFTPHWIVKYMVENSLGRTWLESYPDSSLKSKWEYYLEETDQNAEVKKKLEEMRYKNINPESITFLDPSCGSGHILVYAFDMLYEMYLEKGYIDDDIPKLILEKNLFGLDIDDRAVQLSSFAVMMKAREKSRRIFRQDIKLNICAIHESNWMREEIINEIIDENAIGLPIEEQLEVLKNIRNTFKDAKEYGSILIVESFDLNFLDKRLKDLSKETEDQGDILQRIAKNEIIEKLPKILLQARILGNKYNIVCTNPPYMGGSGMGAKLSDYLKRNYPNTKMDLFSAFIEKGFFLTQDSGYNCMVTMQSWMFLSSFEKMRMEILRNKTISTLLHMDNMVMGIAFGTSATVFRNVLVENYKGTYLEIKYSDLNNKNEPSEFPFKENRIAQVCSEDFSEIPGQPIAYWITDKVKRMFSNGVPLEQKAQPKQGMATCDNKRFLRFWFEVSQNKLNYNAKNSHEAIDSRMKWFPYHKGGAYRKWSGNFEYVVNWENNGAEVKEFTNMLSKDKPGGRIKNEDYYFKKGLTWSTLSSGSISFRYFEEGFLFDTKGSVCFPNDIEDIYYLAGLLNSNVVNQQMKILAPTMDYNPQAIRRIPYIHNEERKSIIELYVKEAIMISKNDWDSYETSWSFVKHPLLKSGYENENISRIKNSFERWSAHSETQFNRLKEIEEQLNRIYIEIYDIQDEYIPSVDDKEITLRKADLEKDIKSFISYAIGCSFGRYSLDEDGLIYAGGEFESSRYKVYKAVKDNILPIITDAYFEDEAVTRLLELVRVVYGEESLEENLDFIASSLGRKNGESARETLRRYLLNDFYKEHIQTYSKKPIYWLFTSGKHKAFNCLIYMHRYDKSTLSRIRTDYLHELQIRMDAEKKTLLDVINGDGTTKEIANAKKELKSLDLKIEELRAYDEKLHHMADMQIEIDLDDGVAVNYAKFDGLLAPIK
ncbi:BREX-1 system adenine-specific DNA-methyltransferase PglX [Paenibacillus xylanilyticus]|uniref:site-specific DNA-methyltransferase (adenine-specific) n=1 Tax=Paenibacillus xylanilyticus TaxID=248903 RepID=A0A7Y6EUU6_9BACL|nr:BREX-1 system adenine-specific DNA-methyltransferase PglX [Paenibacillus xylanilyticus]NUU75084.1 BREX-1 system adenine-specific DNA-methyltransferase PglX [Paenibacillus xylanilyticus]